jgi:hypothetical protein
MIRYGDEQTYPMRVKSLQISGERMRQWWNASIAFEWGADMQFPQGLENPSVLFMVTPSGELIDSVILNDGMDSEYLLEDAEKAILLAHVKFHLPAWIQAEQDGSRGHA